INQVDGIFGPETENAVRTFQRIFDLTADGVVGKKTWYRISYIYVAVKKLAELNSEGERPQYDDNSYPGLLRFGDTGTAVQNLQFYLKNIAAFNPFVSDLEIDGFFGRKTENSVLSFQKTYGLLQDGIVGENTWNRIVQVYLDITEGGSLILRPYPGKLLRIGSSGDDVLYEQILLNRIRPVFATVPRLAEDGVFGSKMRSAVREFQRLFGLSDDGIIGRETWNALNRVFGSTQSGCFDSGPSRSGRTLRYGSSGSDVSLLQSNLNIVGTALSPIPTLTVDGSFGSRTEEAVKVFQRIFGLTPDGVVGTATRTRIFEMAEAVEAGCFPQNRSLTVDFDFENEEEKEVFSMNKYEDTEREDEVEWKREFLSRPSFPDDLIL
ncbi:MAG: peptidoglycan-binding protein, partial [Clostridia bacterium]|nr:peptidoglycan-binding protein [Clostridia bacterium]